MQFKLVKEYSELVFIDEVNKLLKEGWMLKGDHQTVYTSSGMGIVYTQAMVKED